MAMLRSHPALSVAFVSAFLITLGWVSLIHFVYADNPTGLYCHGRLFLVPAWLDRQESIHRTDTPHGYDGQIFHLLAHRPWPLAEIVPYLQPPQLRYQRILIPALAHVLAFGRQAWIDTAYLAVILLALSAGAAATARLAVLRGASPWWGLAFLLLPSSLSSIDRLLVDGPLVAVFSGFLLAWETGRPRAAFLLALAAPFVRETGLILIAAAVLAAFAARGLSSALGWATAALPYGLFSLWLSALPGGLATRFAGWFYSIRLLVADQPPPGSFGWMIHGAALLALAALLGASLRALIHAWRQRGLWASSPRAALWFSAALFSAALWLTSHTTPRAGWDDFYAFGRVFSPILLAVFLEWLACGKPLLAAALIAASTVRMLFQFASPALRILRGLAGA